MQWHQQLCQNEHWCQGVFATVGQQVYRNGKNMWDSLVNVPKGIDRKLFKVLKLTKLNLKKVFILNRNIIVLWVMHAKNQTSSALPIGQMKDFKLKDNYMSALLYSQGWASGDIELMKTIQVFQKQSYSSVYYVLIQTKKDNSIRILCLRQNHIFLLLGTESLKMWNILPKLTHCSRSRCQHGKINISIYDFLLTFCWRFLTVQGAGVSKAKQRFLYLVIFNVPGLGDLENFEDSEDGGQRGEL